MAGLLQCLEAAESEVDVVGVKRGIPELPLDPLRDMEGDGAGDEFIEPGLMSGGLIVLEAT